MGAHSGIWREMGHKMENCHLGVSRKKNISNEFCLQTMLSEALKNCTRWAMLCRTKCDEDGTLQESITLAKVQHDSHVLINTTGRMVVVADVTPGVLKVEHRQTVLHRCSSP